MSGAQSLVLQCLTEIQWVLILTETPRSNPKYKKERGIPWGTEGWNDNSIGQCTLSKGPCW